MSDCIFNDGFDLCGALTEKNCIRCSFYKSSEKYEIGFERDLNGQKHQVVKEKEVD